MRKWWKPEVSPKFVGIQVIPPQQKHAVYIVIKNYAHYYNMDANYCIALVDHLSPLGSLSRPPWPSHHPASLRRKNRQPAKRTELVTPKKGWPAVFHHHWRLNDCLLDGKTLTASSFQVLNHLASILEGAIKAQQDPTVKKRFN